MEVRVKVGRNDLRVERREDGYLIVARCPVRKIPGCVPRTLLISKEGVISEEKGEPLGSHPDDRLVILCTISKKGDEHTVKYTTVPYFAKGFFTEMDGYLHAGAETPASEKAIRKLKRLIRIASFLRKLPKEMRKELKIYL